MAVELSNEGTLACLNFPGRTSSPDDLPALIDAAEAGQGMVLLAHDGRGRQGEHVAELARALAYRTDVAMVAIRLPNSAAAVLRNAVMAVSARVDLSHLPVLIRFLAGRLRTAAAVDSVARMEVGSPTLLQHMRSYLPKACFAVRPGGKVVSGRHAALDAWRDLMTPVKVSAMCSALEAWPDQGRDFAGLLPARTPVMGSQAGEAVKWWGSRNLVEVSWLDEDPAFVAQEVAALPLAACHNCGHGSNDPVCTFCRASLAGNPRERVS
ncbi:MAG: hypothetical protein LBR32_00840 [Propionibacteriaceae bacterium]|jgi:hypothetical protein|nr:hypothetical protein [Propionibacteriaceae bacterium]